MSKILWFFRNRMERINSEQVCVGKWDSSGGRGDGWSSRLPFSERVASLPPGMRCGVDAERNKVMFSRPDGQSLTMDVGPSAIKILQQISSLKEGVKVMDLECTDHFERYCILTLFDQKGCISVSDQRWWKACCSRQNFAWLKFWMWMYFWLSFIVSNPNAFQCLMYVCCSCSFNIVAPVRDIVVSLL